LKKGLELPQSRGANTVREWTSSEKETTKVSGSAAKARNEGSATSLSAGAMGAKKRTRRQGSTQVGSF